MPKPKPLEVTTVRPHPFATAFPRLATAVSFIAAVLNLLVAVARGLWPWRRELALVAVLLGAWRLAGELVTFWPALAVCFTVTVALGAVRPVRVWLLGWLRCSHSRRLLLAGLTETRAANPSGRLPRILRVTRTPVGERVALAVRAGQSAELLEARTTELRAATRCRDVRVTRDPNRSNRVSIDIVRHDPLTTASDVARADQGRAELSMWEPVHLGMTETGEALRLSFVERSLLGGGEPGSGKSSLLNVIAAHAANSPDARLVLIDPNRVQFGPWRHHALAYAADDPADALDVLELVRAEMTRRLSLLESLPGVVRKVTRTIADEHGLPLWVLLIDELAFHTSVVGTPAQRAAFNTAARDIVARCRAAGIVPLMATQRPTSDVVPTSLRDLFSVRCAFRTTTTTSSDVILGESWSRRGFSATDIDLTARGVGWLLAEGHQPQRFKAAWLSDDAITTLTATRQHRPAATPVRPRVLTVPAGSIPAPRLTREVTP